MFLNQKIAQKFVNSIIDNLGYNVNIMNEKGIIIASGFPERIGTFHAIACEVVNQKQRIDIDISDVNEYIGVKEGINIPFFYNGNIAGVVGITGNPKEIENTAKMVRMAVELMIDQEFLKQRVYIHKSQKTFFISKLVSISNEEDIREVKSWALKLEYDLDKSRIVCVFCIKDILNSLGSISSHMREKSKERIFELIQSSPKHQSQDISSYIDTDRVIVFKVIRESSSKIIREEVKDYIDSINDQLLREFKMGLLAGIGTYYPNLEQLGTSYLEAKTMLKFAEVNKKKERTMFAYNHPFEYLFTQIPKEKVDHFLQDYILELEDKPELIKTIRSLVRNNMNILETSKDLYVHKNTVLFRLNKIKSLFNIDPLHEDSDREILRLLTLYLLSK